MKKRHFFYAIAMTFIALSANAQTTFTQIGTDISGDCSGYNVKDLKATSFSFNTAQDSVWFKIETYTAMHDSMDDYLFFLGLDTDLVTNNGYQWPGPHNTSMGFDKVIQIMVDAYDDTSANATDAISLAMIPCVTAHPDSLTFIIGFKLSDIDNDCNFNLLVGTGSMEDTAMGDDMPDGGYMKVRKPVITGISPVAGEAALSVHPIPANGYIQWNTAAIKQGNEQGTITDMNGRALQTFSATAGRADISFLAPGNYIINIGGSATKFIKQ